jgi:hypothetical protein
VLSTLTTVSKASFIPQLSLSKTEIFSSAGYVSLLNAVRSSAYCGKIYTKVEDRSARGSVETRKLTNRICLFSQPIAEPNSRSQAPKTRGHCWSAVPSKNTFSKDASLERGPNTGHQSPRFPWVVEELRFNKEIEDPIAAGFFYHSRIGQEANEGGECSEG